MGVPLSFLSYVSRDLGSGGTSIFLGYVFRDLDSGGTSYLSWLCF